jgi:hypothetical protein
VIVQIQILLVVDDMDRIYCTDTAANHSFVFDLLAIALSDVRTALALHCTCTALHLHCTAQHNRLTD